MIELMGANSVGREGVEPVRQPRLLGEELADAVPMQDMQAVLQLVAQSYQSGWPLRGEVGPASGPQLADTAPNVSGEVLSEGEPVQAVPGNGLPDPAVLDTVEQGQAFVGGMLPLEQVERWLAEQQQLQNRQGALPAIRTLGPDDSLRGADSWQPELRRWAVHPGPVTHLGSLSLVAEQAPSALAVGVTLPQSDVRASASAVTGGALQTAHATGNPSAPVVEVRLAGPEARWGEQMLHALREQVEVQLAQRSQQAIIRLDPPELGSLNIQISHEHGKLNVHINAAQADVARLLTMLSERLRHELIGQNFTEVSVGVGSDSQQGRQQRDQRGGMSESVVVAATEIAASEVGTGQAAVSDILISV